MRHSRPRSHEKPLRSRSIRAHGFTKLIYLRWPLGAAEKRRTAVSEESATVLIGIKPTMNYVLATTMPLNEKKKVVLKARGRAISKAVDVAEIVRRRFVQDASIDAILIGTEEGKSSMDGRPRNVSTIEITITPKKGEAAKPKPKEKPSAKPAE